jgi:hypothetical protein
MIGVRQIVSAMMAASVVWAGAIAAEPAHAHDLDSRHADTFHVLALDAEADHHALIGHHNDAASDDGEGGSAPNPEHGAVFHIHSPCFIAIMADEPILDAVTIRSIILPPEPVVCVLTHATVPPDRPPRAAL